MHMQIINVAMRVKESNRKVHQELSASGKKKQFLCKPSQQENEPTKRVQARSLI